MMLRNKVNNMIKIAVGFLFGFAMMTVMSVETYASPKQMPDGNMFDAGFYAATYPDIAAVLGHDEAALYNHYILCGSKEGRLPYDPSVVAGPMSQEQIYQKLMELKAKYPEGSGVYPEIKFTESRFVGFTIQDEVFGREAKLNIYPTGLREWARNNGVGYRGTQSDIGWLWAPDGYVGQDPVVNAKFEELWSKLQVGDGIKDYENLMVVLTKENDHVTVVLGNDFGEVLWGRKISKEQLRVSMMYVESYIW